MFSGPPKNLGTRKAYRGINTVMLWLEARERQFAAPYWLTYKQAQSLGGQVRKGEHGCPIVKYDTFTKKVEMDNLQTGEADVQEVTIPFCKPYTVFNVEQIDGLDGFDFTPQVFDGVPFDRVMAIGQALCEQTGMRLKYGGNRAYYSPATDTTRLPNTFDSQDGAIATAAHEFTHATGHRKRLDRHREIDGRFDEHQEAYAFEELVAELGAAFLCAGLGVSSQYDAHASYLASWLRKLREDKRFMFRAAAQAARAHDYLVNLVDAATTDQAAGQAVA